MNERIMSGYERAAAAEPMIRALDRMVDLAVKYLRRGDSFCSGCYWELVLKPLLTPMVGWQRGVVDIAEDPDPDAPRFRMLSLDDLPPVKRSEATTETETWLRTMEAWDVVSDYLLAKLDAAECGNGCGFTRAKTARKTS